MNFLSTVAPWIAGAATGGIPALVAMAAKTVSEALGVKVEPNQKAIEAAVANATPEQLLAIKESEQQFKIGMQKLGLEESALYMKDTQDARLAFSKNDNVFLLGVMILIAFSLGMMASMYGAYELLTGGIKVEDMGVVAAVFGFLGTIIGYLSANAQQVVSYYFGSSAGSKQKSDSMSSAFSNLGKK